MLKGAYSEIGLLCLVDSFFAESSLHEGDAKDQVRKESQSHPHKYPRFAFFRLNIPAPIIGAFLCTSKPCITEDWWSGVMQVTCPSCGELADRVYEGMERKTYCQKVRGKHKLLLSWWSLHWHRRNICSSCWQCWSLHSSNKSPLWKAD